MYRKNIYLSWLLSYISILVIPVVIILISYILSVSVIEQEINKAHSASLQQLNQMMDSIFSDIQKVAIDVAWNEKNKAIINYSYQDLTPLQRFNILNFIGNLKTLKVSSRNINSLYVYYKHGGFIVSNNGMCSVEDFYNIYVKDCGLSYEEWLDQLNKPWQNVFVPYKALNNMGQVEKAIAYVRSLPIEKNSESDATLMILLDLDSIYSWLDKMDWINSGYIYIIDENNTIIISSKAESSFFPINYNDLKGTKGTFYTKINNEEVIVSYIYSKITQWKYVVIIPSKIYLQKARFVRDVMVCSILICLFVGGILSWLFTHKNYQPIRNIANMVISNVSNDKFISYNDILSSIRSMMEKDRLIESRLNAQNKILQKHFISRLVTGNINDPVYIHSIFESYNIKLESDLFVVMLFYIEDFSAFYSDKQKDYNPDQSIELVRFIITNVVEELVNTDKHKGFVVEVENMLVCLVNFGNSDLEINKQWVSDIAYKAQDFINKEFGIVISISISSIVEGVEKIYRGYQEAIEAMEYKKLVIGEIPDIIEYDNIRIETPVQNILVGGEEKFINCIKLGQYEEAKNILNSIINREFYKPSVSVKLLKYRMFGLINILLNAVREISIICEDDFIEKIRPIERLLECDNVKQLKYVANDILENVHSYLNKKQTEEQKDMKAAIIQFVQENYADMNLNVSSIAQHFGVSVSYISKYFKKQCGINLLDYIHTVRIEKAKALMQEGKYTVEEIAQMVGYYSSISFIRAFKKYEKITPGRYMNL